MKNYIKLYSRLMIILLVIASVFACLPFYKAMFYVKVNSLEPITINEGYEKLLTIYPNSDSVCKVELQRSGFLGRGGELLIKNREGIIEIIRLNLENRDSIKVECLMRGRCPKIIAFKLDNVILDTLIISDHVYRSVIINNAKSKFAINDMEICINGMGKYFVDSIRIWSNENKVIGERLVGDNECWDYYPKKIFERNIMPDSMKIYKGLYVDKYLKEEMLKYETK
jgi:hypothetical protein